MSLKVIRGFQPIIRIINCENKLESNQTQIADYMKRGNLRVSPLIDVYEEITNIHYKCKGKTVI